MASAEKWSVLANALRRGETPTRSDARPIHAPESRGHRSDDLTMDQILELRGRRDLTKDDGTATTAAFARIRGRMAVRLGLSVAELRGESWLSDGGQLAMSPAFLERRAALAPSLTRARSAGRSSTPVPTKIIERLNAEEIAKLYDEYGRFTFVERHEAGHAVVAHALGMHVYQTSVEGRLHGGTHVSDANDRGGDEDERWLAVTWAGFRAERSHTHWDDHFEALEENEEDHRKIEERIASMGLSLVDEAELRARVVARVDDILDWNRDKLDELTQALFVNRTVSGDRLRRVLKGR